MTTSVRSPIRAPITPKLTSRVASEGAPAEPAVRAEPHQGFESARSSGSSGSTRVGSTQALAPGERRISQAEYQRAIARFIQSEYTHHIDGSSYWLSSWGPSGEYNPRKILKAEIPRDAVPLQLSDPRFDESLPWGNDRPPQAGKQVAFLKDNFLYLSRDFDASYMEDYTLRIPVPTMFTNKDLGWPSEPRSFADWLARNPRDHFIVTADGAGAAVRRAKRSDVWNGAFGE